MEQHPVPQNVTTFQFRLIGDMTIKQFGYLAGGLILAYISYKLPLPFFITWPLALFTGLMGIGFAFIPIEERPMDVWVLSFIKSAYSPTQYVWQKTAPSLPPTKHPTKTGTRLEQNGAAAQNSAVQLSGKANQTASPVTQLFTVHPPVQTPRSRVLPKQDQDDIKKSGLFDALVSLFVTTKKIPIDEPAAFQQSKILPHVEPVAPVAGAHTVTSVSLPNTFDVSHNATILQRAGNTTQPDFSLAATPGVTQTEDAHLQKTEQLEAQVKSLEQELRTKALSDTRILELQKQLTDLLESKQTLEKELIELRRQAIPRPPQPPQPFRMAGVSRNVAPQSTVNIISANNTVRAGIPRLTNIPNIVTGLTKDSEGNLLPGVLITVRDNNDIPMRALKTNKLGQFAASTPLPNGTYVIEVEDPRQRFLFDRAQITLTGAVVPPLEIIAKSQKELTRQKLAQELFGNQTI